MSTAQIQIDISLCAAGARINDVGPSGHLPLGEASAAGYKRVVEALLANNADVEVTSPARNSATPLAIAVANKQHAVADMLIKVTSVCSCIGQQFKFAALWCSGVKLQRQHKCENFLNGKKGLTGLGHNERSTDRHFSRYFLH